MRSWPCSRSLESGGPVPLIRDVIEPGPKRQRPLADKRHIASAEVETSPPVDLQRVRGIHGLLARENHASGERQALQGRDILLKVRVGEPLRHARCAVSVIDAGGCLAELRVEQRAAGDETEAMGDLTINGQF